MKNKKVQKQVNIKEKNLNLLKEKEFELLYREIYINQISC